ncbi:phosphoglucomutase-like protein [Polychaeton citri CBS 116435]|uniref:Phosphoglucomutase-like protein n=1 Tax=Polychaeton citri CBS 116435 TaxID=1314669 RepID=A0A9P4UQ31_9PEZI|nr:phosphoglucomutase-like protein [Polychaeton citri CBS 116435]
MSVPSTVTLARRWLEIDQDPATRQEIEDLVKAQDVDELERRLRTRISFGTAGLRSSMKAGFAHMNALTVLQASQGLADYILPIETDVYRRNIVVGYDARHNSEKFARLAAAAFITRGFRVLWFGQLVHTPLVPFAVGKYGAAAGVMVTASHNPKNDNGYKVYWGNGSQIIPPHDIGIAEAISNVREILTWDETLVDTSHAVENIFRETLRPYNQALCRVRETGHGSCSFTYTPMHGVGLPFMHHAMRLMGFSRRCMHVVPAQADPDPEFSTVPFPNPEERGALDLAMKTAEENDCPIILANDPDADRFAVAERLPNGRWQQLTGNQTGVLLASYVLETYKLGPVEKLAMLASAVSSRMLSAMAKKEGFRFEETLTGFKWLGNVAQKLNETGYDAMFAYEEAIGYMFSSVVWDKDGIAAASAFISAYLLWRSQGLTPWAKLQTLYEKYGYFEDANTYLITPRPEVTGEVFARIRSLNGGQRPETLGGRPILRWRDLTIGYDSASEDGTPDLPVDASAQMITCEFEDVVFTVRGSGTEPKIKIYIEGTGDSSQAAKQKAQTMLQALLEEWFPLQTFGLRLPGT